MIAAFTPHPKSGAYPYPLTRTNEDPFIECNDLVKSNLVMNALTGTRSKKDISLMLGWVLVQYFLNPPARQWLPDIKPLVTGDETSVMLGFGPGIPAGRIKFTPTLEALACLMTKELLSQHHEVETYFGILHAQTTKFCGKPGDLAFKFTEKADKQMPAGQRVVIRPDTDYFRTYNIVSPKLSHNRTFTAKWINRVEWETPDNLPPTDASTMDSLILLGKHHPSKAAKKRFDLEMGKLCAMPRPEDLAGRIQHAQTILSHYKAYYTASCPSARGVHQFSQTPVLAISHEKQWLILTMSKYQYSGKCEYSYGCIKPGFMTFDGQSPWYGTKPTKLSDIQYGTLSKITEEEFKVLKSVINDPLLAKTAKIKNSN
jgi:hypothetical protein